jgi:undecaprenyl-diphosphatase
MEAVARSPRWPWWLMGLALATHLASWFLIGPLQDEAYYWTWTQYPQLSYFDHPPMVAWMMMPFTTVIGDQTWVLRLPMVLAWLAAAWLIHATARRLYRSPRTGLYALLVWTSLPIVMGGFHIATPDTPLVLFTALTYFLFFQALETGSDRDWLTTGAAAGLALLSKYTAILVPGALFLALLLTRRGRSLLLSRGPWLAVAAMVVMFLPVVVWNAQNDWVSFLFQIHHGVKDLKPDAGSLLMAFVAGQLGVALPWTFIAMLVASLRMGRHGETEALPRVTLQLGLWVPLLVFGTAGLTAESGANWTLTAFIPGSILLAATLSRWTAGSAKWRPALLALLYLFPVVLLNLFRFPQWMEAVDFDPPQRTQLTHSYGWERVADTLHRELQGLGERGEHCTVMGMNYQLASELALILKDAHRVTTPEGSRISQYDLWRGENRDICLYVEQYDQHGEPEPRQVVLPDGTHWRRVALLENHNPDNTVRWFGFFVPEAGN